MSVISLEIETDIPFANAQAFGERGAYRLIEGCAHLAIGGEAIGADGIYTPASITTGPDGLIHAWGDFSILAPADPTMANGTLLVELVNRGGRRLLHTYNNGPMTNLPRRPADAGNGWLLKEGYTLLSVAWQGDVLPGDGRLTMSLPGYTDDAPTRIATEYVVFEEGISVVPLSGMTSMRSYPAASLDTSRARLTRRRYPDSAREEIASDAWAFERVETSPGGKLGFPPPENAIWPSDSHLRLSTGFRPGWIYQLEYDATGALALDVGFLVMGELVSFLRHETDGNPLCGTISRTIGAGRSQAGRALREFLWRGFNADHRGRRIFDGALPHIAGAGKIPMNRYSNLSIAAARDYEDHDNPSDLFPFSYARSTDHLTGAQDAILKRPPTDPKVIHTQSSAEYWHRRGSLVHTDTAGNDLAQPDDVRVYLWTGSHHTPFSPPMKPVAGPCAYLMNNVITAPFDVGTLVLMQAWLRDGQQPPASRIPSVGDGTLVPVARYVESFPGIAGSILPRDVNALPLIDYGADFARGGAAPANPPLGEGSYTVLVPAADRDGNDIAGIRPPMLSAPLGTYTGWNLRGPGHAQGKMFPFMGAYLPFPETPEQAALTADPRPDILTRFPTPQSYQSAIWAAAEILLADGFIIAGGLEEFVGYSANWGAINHVHSL
ncbi:hypothetical protein SAMN06295905_2284 [Devosia lucknowensis]|uniref:Alpha/beta hydrolase domain-containing protein n=1 Tax=Devosia lucknowensis TaxID=1096929 RepID=A0A1Y6FMJ8_9HYPH|nr:alpha/beta hydrolase domain-containing protein [Devosia lucknowensis]SMQ74072.1 hypothetical protein SAMN06295905_2284 [Devosia lucknowensis]